MKKIINVDKQEVVFPESMSSKAVDFIERLIQKNPESRMKASDALVHPFLRDVKII